MGWGRAVEVVRWKGRGDMLLQGGVGKELGPPLACPALPIPLCLPGVGVSDLPCLKAQEGRRLPSLVPPLVAEQHARNPRIFSGIWLTFCCFNLLLPFSNVGGPTCLLRATRF